MFGPGQDRQVGCDVVSHPLHGLIVCLWFQSSRPTSVARYPPPEAQHLDLPVREKPPTDHPGRRPPRLVLLVSPALVCGLRPELAVFQEVKQYYEDYQQMKQQQREEAEAGQEVTASKQLTLWFPWQL